MISLFSLWRLFYLFIYTLYCIEKSLFFVVCLCIRTHIILRCAFHNLATNCLTSCREFSRWESWRRRSAECFPFQCTSVQMSLPVDFMPKALNTTSGHSRRTPWWTQEWYEPVSDSSPCNELTSSQFVDTQWRQGFLFQDRLFPAMCFGFTKQMRWDVHASVGVEHVWAGKVYTLAWVRHTLAFWLNRTSRPVQSLLILKWGNCCVYWI